METTAVPRYNILHASAPSSHKVRKTQLSFGLRLRTLASDRELLNATIKLREDSLSLLRKCYEAGETTDLDLARAESELGTARADLACIERRRANQEHALAVLTGVAPSQFGLAARPFDTAPLAVPAGLPSELLERRPDIAAAERQMAGRQCAHRYRQGRVLPTHLADGAVRLRVVGPVEPVQMIVAHVDARPAGEHDRGADRVRRWPQQLEPGRRPRRA